VQTDLEGALKDPAIDLVIGNNRKKDIAQILEEYLAEREVSGGQGLSKTSGKQGAGEGADMSCAELKTLGGTTVLDIAHEKAYEEMQLKTTAEHTRAYVKIQDGCNQFCSYCAIPLARGRVRSRKAEDIISEIRGIVDAGYLEIVLTGIHVSSYGIDFARKDAKAAASTAAAASADASAQGGSATTARDYRGETHLFDLIEKIHEVPGLKRIRVSSMEPRIVTPKAAKRLAALPKVCPHFHLSLQSGCDATLKRMNRHYTAQQYLESVQALRDAYAPRVPAITTDVIVGFPGETEEEFETTQAFLQKVGFYEMHVFKYSKRKGTRAAVMPDQVPDQVKAERSDVLLALEREQSVAFRKNKLGQTEEVLFEEEKVVGGKQYLLGHTMDYVKVALPITQGKAQKAPKQMGTLERQTPKVPTSGTLCTLTLQEFLTEEILLGHEATLF